MLVCCRNRPIPQQSLKRPVRTNAWSVEVLMNNSKRFQCYLLFRTQHYFAFQLLWVPTRESRVRGKGSRLQPSTDRVSKFLHDRHKAWSFYFTEWELHLEVQQTARLFVFCARSRALSTAPLVWYIDTLHSTLSTATLQIFTNNIRITMIAITILLLPPQSCCQRCQR